MSESDATSPFWMEPTLANATQANATPTNAALRETRTEVSDLVRSSPLRTLVAFDFDGTLIEGDSFWQFLGGVAGWPQTAWAFVQSLVAFFQERVRSSDGGPVPEARTFIKTQLIERLLKGRSVANFQGLLDKLRRAQRWNNTMRQAYLEHAQLGHHIIIISGALDLYLSALVRDLPCQAIICTRVGVADGVVTGTLPLGNCVRERKAELLKHYIDQEGPFDDSWGYGNYPHDVPMLQLLRQRILV